MKRALNRWNELSTRYLVPSGDIQKRVVEKLYGAPLGWGLSRLGPLYDENVDRVLRNVEYGAFQLSSRERYLAAVAPAIPVVIRAPATVAPIAATVATVADGA